MSVPQQHEQETAIIRLCLCGDHYYTAGIYIIASQSLKHIFLQNDFAFAKKRIHGQLTTKYFGKLLSKSCVCCRRNIQHNNHT